MVLKFLYFSLIIIGMNSCASIPFLSDDKASKLEGENPTVAKSKAEPEPVKVLEMEEESIVKTPMDELELKIARLWARVDELEEKTLRQKEKLKILEQGLMLGTVPQELKESLIKIDKQIPPKKMALRVKESPGIEKAGTLKIIDEDSKEVEKLKESLSNAKNLFRSGRYGKAFLAFSRIEKEHNSDLTQGEEKFWLGRCWHKLKELQSSKQSFEDFLSKYPNSPLAASAKFHLGKVAMDMGLKEIAIKQFQDIVRDHPYEGTAEAAKQVLANYKTAL